MTPTLRDLAEDAFAYLPGPSIEIDRRTELVLRNQRGANAFYGMVLRPRLGDVDQALATAREWFAERGRGAYTWLVSDASTPEDLVESLLAAGLEPDSLDPVYSGMVLEDEPKAATGVEVRKASGYEDARAAAEISWRSFGFTNEQIAAARELHRKNYDDWKDFEGGDRFVAVVDGEIVGSGGAAYTAVGVYLVGGNVDERFRGQGVYRALVHARWQEAVRRGTPALVVQAGAMSRPILEGLGFESVCTVHALLDPGA